MEDLLLSPDAGGDLNLDWISNLQDDNSGSMEDVLANEDLDAWLSSLTSNDVSSASPLSGNSGTTQEEVTSGSDSSFTSSPEHDFRANEIEDLIDYVVGDDDQMDEVAIPATACGEETVEAEETMVVAETDSKDMSLGDHDYLGGGGVLVRDQAAAAAQAQPEIVIQSIDTTPGVVTANYNTFFKHQQQLVKTRPPKFITILPAAAQSTKTQIKLVTLHQPQHDRLTSSSSTEDDHQMTSLAHTKKRQNVSDVTKDNVIVKRLKAGGRAYPQLILTNEEKRMCEKDGIVLPAFYPLTKAEEANLKKVRRKIRNKISAQSSRKRKKDYVDDMEARAVASETENKELKRKVKILESQNKTLIAQLKRMQSLITGGGKAGSGGQKSATALMVLLLSTALFAVPGFREQYGDGKSELKVNGNSLRSPEAASFTPRVSRSLLHYVGDNLNNQEDGISNILNKIEEYDSSNINVDDAASFTDSLRSLETKHVLHDDEKHVFHDDGLQFLRDLEEETDRRRETGEETRQQKQGKNRTNLLTTAAEVKSFQT